MSRQQGYKAKSNGKLFESIIDMSCIHYLRQGKAAIEKTPEPLKMLRSTPRGREVIAVFEKRAQPDYQGTLKDGKSILFEAKHTDDTSIRFDRVSTTQSEYLATHAKLGAECYVLLSFKFKSFYFVPWNDWLLLEYKTGKKSVNATDLSEYQVQYERGIVNFLGG